MGLSIAEQADPAPRKITEQEIDALVDRFYTKVQADAEIGPIFNARVHSWPAHLALLKDFWSSVLLTSGRYKGQPMLTHLNLPLEETHFRRWLSLFEETAREVMPAAQAVVIVAKANQIANNFKLAIAYQRGQVVAPLV